MMEPLKYKNLTALEMLNASKAYTGSNSLLTAMDMASARTKMLDFQPWWNKSIATSGKIASMYDINSIRPNLFDNHSSPNKILSTSTNFSALDRINSARPNWYDKPDWAKMLTTSTNTVSVIARQLIDQPNWFDQQKGIAKMFAITENMGTVVAKSNIESSVFDNISHMLSTSKNAFIQTKIVSDAFSKIISNNQNIFRTVDTFKTKINHTALTTSLAGWETALSGVGRQISADVLKYKDKSMLQNFEKVTSKVVSITDTISTQKSITPDFTTTVNEGLAELKTEIFAKLDLSGKDTARQYRLGIYLWILGVIISLLLAYYQPVAAGNKEAVSKEEFVDFKKEVLGAVYGKMAEEIPAAFIKTKCTLFLKPNSHCLRLMTLYPPLAITVVEKKGKWNRVTFLSSEGDAITGWMLQKHLTSPKLTRKKKR